MTSSPSRGLLYPTPPEYDVFKTRDETNTEDVDSPATTDADETDVVEETDEATTPMMSRANWTGTVPADD